MRLLGRLTSINVRKVAWTADFLGIGYEREDWGLPIRDPKVPEYLALNPNATIPVLIDGDFTLWESNVIMRYLAEKEGSGRLLPDDLRQRALVNQWLTWQATEVNPVWGYAVHALLRKNPAYGDAARVGDSARRWTGTMQILEAQLAKTGAFVAGDTFSLADIALGLSIHRYFSTPIEHPALPSISAYYERLKSSEFGGAPYLGETTP